VTAGAYFIDPISSYPPTFQIVGDSDEAWDAAHLTAFHDKLRQNQVPSAVLVVSEVSHAFENVSKVGDLCHLRYLRPGVEFVCRFVETRGHEEEK
jgi:acetyl esterase/lipase